VVLLGLLPVGSTGKPDKAAVRILLAQNGRQESTGGN
jgi:hypothetical protein